MDKDIPVLSAKTFNPLNVLLNIMFLALICCGFLRQGPSYTHCCCALTLALAGLSCHFWILLYCTQSTRDTVHKRNVTEKPSSETNRER